MRRSGWSRWGGRDCGGGVGSPRGDYDREEVILGHERIVHVPAVEFGIQFGQ